MLRSRYFKTMFVEKFPQNDAEKLAEIHDEKALELLPIMYELKNYVHAKEDLRPLETQLDEILHSTQHSNYATVAEKIGQIELYKSIIEKYEQENHITDDGLIKIKDTLAEIEKEYINHSELREQFKGNRDDFYTKN